MKSPKLDIKARGGWDLDDLHCGIQIVTECKTISRVELEIHTTDVSSISLKVVFSSPYVCIFCRF